MKTKKYTIVCKQILFVLLCILMADCCIFGAGRIFTVGALGFRMILVGVICIIGLPICFLEWIILIKNKYFLAILVFGLWQMVEAFRGIIAGNRPGLILSDIKGFMYFILLPIMLLTLVNKQRILMLMKVGMYASTVLSLFSILLIAVYIKLPSVFNEIFEFGLERNFSGFGAITPALPRLFFHSSMYAVCGCAFAMFFYMADLGKKTIKYILIASFNLVALLLTFTRSIYLGTGAAAVFLGIIFWFHLKNEGKRRLLNYMSRTTVVFLIMVIGIGFCTRENYLDYAFQRTFGFSFVQKLEFMVENSNETIVENNNETIVENNSSSKDRKDQYQELTKESDQYRKLTIDDLIEKIQEAPLVGSGLGAELEFRPEGYNEYIFLDIWVKSGIVGLVLYIVPLIVMCYDGVKKILRRDSDDMVLISLLAVLLGFFTFSFFNPYMNASLGIIFYCFCMAGFSWQIGIK